MKTSKTLLNDKGIQKLFHILGADNLRLVGGCVRDDLLGKSGYDIDLATKHKPSETWKLLEKAGVKTIPTGIKHGTITAIINQKPYEITTLRSDINCDGRHAEVEYIKSWQQDSKRRDFTFNALYADINGNVDDFHGGIEDLKTSTVKFIGNAKQRIEEDGLRIYRYFRFNSIFGNGTFEAPTLKAIKDSIELTKNISAERIYNEVVKIFEGKSCLKTIGAMQNCSLWQDNLDINALKTALELNTYTETKLISLLNNESASSYLKAWKAPNSIKNTFKLFSANYEDYQYLKFLNEIGQERFLQLLYYKKAKQQITPKQYEEMIALATTWQIVDFPVSGADLLALGYQENSALGKTINNLKADWYKSYCKLERNFLISKAKEQLNK